MNVIFIVIDALRASALGCYGFKEKISPNIDGLAKQGVLFENAYSCVNTTDPSITTMFTGKYPLSHGIIKHGSQVKKEDIEKFYKNNKLTLAKILKSEGYKTLAVDWLGRWHRIGFDYYSGILRDQQYGETRKYKEADDNILSYFISKLQKYPTLFRMAESFKYKISGKRAREISRALIFGDAGKVTEQAKQLIRKNLNNRFFLFIHYWDTHAPYYCPTRYAEKYYEASVDKDIEEILKDIKRPERKDTIKSLGVSVNRIVANYHGAIEFVDDQIGELIQFLDALEILDQTLIVLTSDHGESLMEHGIYFDHHGLYDVTIHVPLIFRCPETLPANRRISAFVQHVDILPTILDILGMSHYDYLDGNSLIPLINGEVSKFRDFVFVEEAQTQRKIAIRTNKYKYIKSISKQEAVCKYCGVIHGGLEELYNLENDPDENKNIVNTNPEITKELSEKLYSFILHLEERKQEQRTIREKITRLKLGRI